MKNDMMKTRTLSFPAQLSSAQLGVWGGELRRRGVWCVMGWGGEGGVGVGGAGEGREVGGGGERVDRGFSFLSAHEG